MGTLNNGFCLIYDFEEMRTVVKFLESGLSLDHKQSERIINRLKDQISTVPKAAVFCHENEIKIAILLFDQTNIASNARKVINLSAWYARETHRGIEAIRFAKKLTAVLTGYTITNYTPNAAALKIFKVLGYKDMRVRFESVGFQKKFPFIKLSLREKYFTFTSPFILPIDLAHDQKDMITSSSFKIISVKKGGIKLKTLNIYVDTKETHISLFWLIKTVLVYATIRINIYSRIETVPKDSLWLVKNIETERYISPRNSELSVYL